MKTALAIIFAAGWIAGGIVRPIVDEAIVSHLAACVAIADDMPLVDWHCQLADAWVYGAAEWSDGFEYLPESAAPSTFGREA